MSRAPWEGRGLPAAVQEKAQRQEAVTLWLCCRVVLDVTVTDCPAFSICSCAGEKVTVWSWLAAPTML